MDSRSPWSGTEAVVTHRSTADILQTFRFAVHLYRTLAMYLSPSNHEAISAVTWFSGYLTQVNKGGSKTLQEGDVGRSVSLAQASASFVLTGS